MKVIGVIATVFGAVLALTQLYDWFARPSPNIILTVKEYPLVYPESFVQFFEMLADSDRLAVASQAKWNDVTKSSQLSREDQVEHVHNVTENRLLELKQMELAYGIEKLIPDGLTNRYSLGFRKFVDIDISNDGSARASNLILRLLPYGQVTIRPATGDIYELPPESYDRIELGELLPGESISVSAWDSDSVSNFSDADEITLFYDDGFVQADVHSMVPAFWAGVAKYWTGILYLMVSLTVMLGLPIVANFVYIAIKRKEDEKVAETASVTENESDQPEGVPTAMQ